MYYKMSNFNENEVFRIGMNGITLSIDNKEDQDGATEDFMEFESDTIPQGTHSLDIAVLSDFQQYDPKFVSQAHVVIKNITIENTIRGGAEECLPCPAGHVNSASDLKSHCSLCPPGMEPNADQSECVKCKEGYFKPDKRGACKQCVAFTYSNKQRTKCLPYD